MGNGFTSNDLPAQPLINRASRPVFLKRLEINRAAREPGREPLKPRSDQPPRHALVLRRVIHIEIVEIGAPVVRIIEHKATEPDDHTIHLGHLNGEPVVIRDRPQPLSPERVLVFDQSPSEIGLREDVTIGELAETDMERDDRVSVLRCRFAYLDRRSALSNRVAHQ
jgi:hypothetical protein